MARRDTTPQSGREAVVDWSDVTATVVAVVSTGPADEVASRRLALGLARPATALDRLGRLADAGLDGDAHAARELRSVLGDLARFLPAPSSSVAPQCPAPPCGDGDGCGSASTRQALPSRAVEATHDPVDDSRPTVRPAAVVGLLQQVALLHADAAVEERLAALDVVAAVAVAASVLGEVVTAYRDGGPDGVAERIGELADAQALTWVRGDAGPPTAQTMSGGVPSGGGFGGDLPDFPGLPGFPGRGDVPGGLPGPGRKGIEDLLHEIRDPRSWWDPDHWFPEVTRRPARDYVDWRNLPAIRCVLDVLAVLRRRAALLPPVVTPGALTSHQITSLATSGSCAGDTLVVHGTDLPARTAVELLLPFADGCHPVTVPAAAWTRTTITVTIPAGMVSGPVGFVSREYLAAYEAWRVEQDRLGGEADAYECWRKTAVAPRFSACPIGTSLNQVRAGAPSISSFTANGSSPGLVESGQKVVLAWTVANAEHVRLERVAGTGPLPAGVAALDDPAGTSIVLGRWAVSAPTTTTYRLTATGPCGGVTRDVVVAASRRPGLWLGGIEVTQSIQTNPVSVRLVESKPTVVRATVRHTLGSFGSGTVPAVRGRIQVRRAGGAWSPWFDAANGTSPMAPNPGAQITAGVAPDRSNTDDTLNFLVPPAWCTGTVSYRVEVRTSGFGSTTGFAGFDDQASTTTGPYVFGRRRVLDLRFVRVSWGGAAPTDATCRATLLGAVPLLPTPSAAVSALGGVGLQTGSDDDDRDDLLDDFDDRHNCSTLEALTEWLGSDCPDDDGAIWVLIPGVFSRGRAYDIPSNVCFTPPGDGPYAAHELAHCLDQEHVGVLCANGQKASGGDAPSDWPNNAQLTDVPFDSLRNKALSLTAMPGVFDLMTYCGSPNNTWPMPVRYQRLWDEIGG